MECTLDAAYSGDANAQAAASEYRSLHLQEKFGVAVVDAICNSLKVGSWKRQRRGSKHKENLELLLYSRLHLRHPDYRDVTHRFRLKRILCPLAHRHPRMGYNAHFALFASLVLAGVRQNKGNAQATEKQAFGLLESIYARLHLADYYEDDSRSKVAADVWKVCLQTEQLWPGTVKAFADKDLWVLLQQSVEDLLLSLLAKGFDPDTYKFSTYLPLLSRLFVASNTSEDDPRRSLRHIVVCVLGTHLAPVALEPDRDIRLHQLERLRKGIHVEEKLLLLVDNDVQPEQCSRMFAASWTPIGMAAGWLAGMQAGQFVATLLGAGAASVLGPVLAPGLGLAGLGLGGIVAFGMGSFSGARFAQSAVKEITFHAPQCALQDRDLSGPEGGGHYEHHRGEGGTKPSPAQLLSLRPRTSYQLPVVEEDAEADEPDFDWFRGGDPCLPNSREKPAAVVSSHS